MILICVSNLWYIGKHCKLILSSVENTSLNRQHRLHDYHTDLICFATDFFSLYRVSALIFVDLGVRWSPEEDGVYNLGRGILFIPFDGTFHCIGGRFGIATKVLPLKAWMRASSLSRVTLEQTLPNKVRNSSKILINLNIYLIKLYSKTFLHSTIPVTSYPGWHGFMVSPVLTDPQCGMSLPVARLMDRVTAWINITC